MIWASLTVIAIIAGFLFLGIAAQRSSGNLAWLGIALLVIGSSPVVLPWLSRLPSFQDLVSTTHASSSKLDAIYAEAKRMVQQARMAPTKMPTIVSVERITEPGVYDDVLLVYGYPDNYAAAREIAEYASRKYKRDYRFTPVELLEAFNSRSDNQSAPRPVKKPRYPVPGERDTTGWVPHLTSPALECRADNPTHCRLSR